MSEERNRRHLAPCLIWGIAVILAGYGAVFYQPFNAAGSNPWLFLLPISIIGFAKNLWLPR
jgi:hypothetical protein